MKPTSRRFKRKLSEQRTMPRHIEASVVGGLIQAVNVTPPAASPVPNGRWERFRQAKIWHSRVWSGLGVFSTLLSTLLAAVALYYAWAGFDVAGKSLEIAKRTFEDQERSGPIQQKTLEDSRDAASAIVRSSREQVALLDRAASAALRQQQILDRGVRTADASLSLSRSRDAEERKRLARKPDLQLGIGFQSEPGSEDYVPVWEPGMSLDGLHLLCPRSKDGDVRFVWFVRNVGDALAVQPRMEVIAEPRTVLLSADAATLSLNNSNHAGRALADIPPNNVMDVPFLYDFFARTPKGVDRWKVTVLLWTATSHKKLTIQYDVRDGCWKRPGT